MTAPRRLLHVIDDARPIGGAQTYLHGLSAGLLAEGWECGLLAGTLADGPFVHAAALTGDAATDAAAVEAFDPDVVLVHTLDDAALVARVARRRQTLLYVHDYRQIAPGNLRFLQRSETFCSEGFGLRCLLRPYTERCNNRRPDRIASSVRRVLAWRKVWPELAGVLCATEFVARLHREHGVPPDLIRVVGYFAEPPAAAVERSADADAPPRDVLFVGRTSPVKGGAHLVGAFARLAPEFPASNLLLVGGPGTGGLDEVAEAAGVSARVAFPGWLRGAELEAAFARAAVFVMPSVWPEAFGIAALEAQVRGIPVVASAVGGVPDWLVEGAGARLVPPADDAALAEAIGGLLRDPAAAVRLGEAGRSRVREEFSLQAHLDRLLPLLESTR